VVVSRTSSRITRDGIPIADKASALASRRDNIQGIILDNPFIVLHFMHVSVMQSILVDLDIEVEDVDEQLGLSKLKI
jgi:ABC-type sulfate transport system permease component